MDNMQYNFNGIYRLFSVTGNETLSISVYQGAASMVVFKKGTESRRPVVKMSLGDATILKLVDILTNLMDASPETRMPFLQMTFNRETRAYEQTTSFVFFKDERRCYGVEVSNRAIPTPIKFIFKCPSTFSTGSEAMTDEQKSTLGLKEFIRVLDRKLEVATLLSRFNMDPLQNKGSNRNGNFNRGGNQGGQQRAPYSSGGGASIAGEEDSVFG